MPSPEVAAQALSWPGSGDSIDLTQSPPTTSGWLPACSAASFCDEVRVQQAREQAGCALGSHPGPSHCDPDGWYYKLKRPFGPQIPKEEPQSPSEFSKT